MTCQAGLTAGGFKPKGLKAPQKIKDENGDYQRLNK